MRFDPRLFLVSTLPAALRARPSAEPIIKEDVVIQLVVRDVAGLDVYYVFRRDRIEVQEGVSNKVELTVCMYAAELELLADGKLDVPRAMRRGQMIAIGDRAAIGWLASWPALGLLLTPVAERLAEPSQPKPEPPVVRDARRLAYLELLQLSNDPHRDRDFRAWIERVLKNELGVKRSLVEAFDVPVDVPIRIANQRRQRALLVLLVDPNLPPAIREQVIDRLGTYGDEGAVPALEAVLHRPGSAAAVKTAKRAIAEIRRASRLTIVFAAMEAKPYCGAGGLGNVMSELPRALAKMGHQVMVIVPRHEVIDRRGLVDTHKQGMVFGPEGTELFGIFHDERDGASYYFIENDRYFSRGRKGIYGSDKGDYPDNAERYDFFGAAIPQAIRTLLRRPPDIVQLNDAHTASAAAYLKRDPAFEETKVVLAVHNLGGAYQGRFNPEHLPKLRFTGLGVFHESGPAELGGQINFLKLGLLESNAAVTVSRQYMREVLEEGMGEGLHGTSRVLYARERFWGNLNGIDVSVWSPATDPLVEQPFSYEDATGKKTCKAALQRRAGLPVEGEVPLFGVVARLTEQKGFDDLIPAIDKVAETGRPAQFLIIGQGDPAIAERLKKLEKKYPHSVRFDGDFNVEKEHRVYAGADFFLMPSKFEPSGLPQMYALRYLTIPVVRSVGGLEESIEAWNAKKKTGNGFKFSTDLVACLEEALAWYEQGEKARQTLIKNAARSDFSWETTSAVEQVAFYRKILRGSGA
jgi:starch synthase